MIRPDGRLEVESEIGRTGRGEFQAGWGELHSKKNQKLNMDQVDIMFVEASSLRRVHDSLQCLFLECRLGMIGTVRTVRTKNLCFLRVVSQIHIPLQGRDGSSSHSPQRVSVNPWGPLAMASNLIAVASNLLAMASNLISMGMKGKFSLQDIVVHKSKGLERPHGHT